LFFAIDAVDALVVAAPAGALQQDVQSAVAPPRPDSRQRSQRFPNRIVVPAAHVLHGRPSHLQRVTRSALAHAEPVLE
jgi:hypothetical protein